MSDPQSIQGLYSELSTGASVFVGIRPDGLVSIVFTREGIETPLLLTQEAMSVLSELWQSVRGGAA